jgi:hypothetical protein
MIPEISHYILPLQKMHLFLYTTANHFPITELHKEILPNTNQLQNLKIKSININNFSFLINRQHILQYQPNNIWILQERPKRIFDTLYLSHRIKPEPPSGQ